MERFLCGRSTKGVSGSRLPSGFTKGLGFRSSGFRIRVQVLGFGLSVRALGVQVWPVGSGFRNNAV